MKWLNQFSLVMRSSVTTLKEKIEDPERLLHQLLIDMEEELDHVRGSVAEAIADEIQLADRRDRETAAADQWQQRATEAIKRGNENKAKAALEQKLLCDQRITQYTADHSKQKSEVEKLQRSVNELEDKIWQAKHKKSLLTARMARATSAQKINSALDRTHSKSAFAQFGRLEEKVQREEAITDAWQRMQGKDLDAEALAQDFERQEHEQRIVDELSRLKSTLANEQ